MAASPISLNDVHALVDAARTEYEKAMKEVAQLGGRYFAYAARDLFEKYPALETFGWSQAETLGWSQADDVYNDETYEFEVHREAAYITINGVNFDETYDWETHTRMMIPVPEYADIFPIFEEVEEFLAKFEEADLRLIFGDNATITVDREGATIS